MQNQNNFKRKNKYVVVLFAFSWVGLLHRANDFLVDLSCSLLQFLAPLCLFRPLSELACLDPVLPSSSSSSSSWVLL